MPSITEITVAGSNAEKSVTTSKCERPPSRATSAVAHVRTVGSSSAIRRGVKRRAITLRMWVWSGGSMWIMDLEAPWPSSSSATPLLEV